MDNSQKGFSVGVKALNNKQKVREVWNYQFVVYEPQKPNFTKKGDCYEIAGHTYPFRNKKFNIYWLDAFDQPKPKKKKWKTRS